MTKQTKKTKLLTIRIDEQLLTSYKNYCDKYGYNISKRIRLYILSEITNS